MKFRGYIFLAFAVASASASEETSAPTTALEYLNHQLREIKVEIAKSYSPDPPLAADRTYDVRWDRLWEKDVNSTEHTLAMSFSNETFVLVNERVLRVEVDVSEKLTLHEVAVIRQQNRAKFVRTTAWKKLLFLLICQEDGSCSLHVGPNANELRFRQIIKHRGLPMDAELFTHANHLYLVVADNSGQFSVPSVIYYWTGTYMDVIAEVTTTGAVSVATFNHKHSTIIVFAQNVKGRPKIGSEVFKFKNGVVEKIQFLATGAPTSVHRYEYEEKTFLLVIDELNASGVFWWDGNEFLEWMKLPEISSPTKVSIVYVGEDTLLLVSEENTLSLYRIMNLAYAKLNLLEIKDRYMITDFNARVKGNSIILVLVTKSEGNLHRVEPIELTVIKFTKEIPREETDDTWEYLQRLDQLLKERMPAVEKARKIWPSLIPFAENVVVSSPLEFDHLVIDSGDIFDLLVSSPAGIMTPTELASGLEQIDLDADSMISESSELLFPNDTAEATGTIFVEGDAFVDEIHLDYLNVSVFNQQRVEFDGVLSYTKNQDFRHPLRGNVVTIQNFEIDSLCGIPFKNWRMANDADQTALDFLADNVKILNETILIQSDVSVDNLSGSRLNNLELSAFVADLFIVGLNQEINGSVFYKRGLNAYALTLNATNGVSADQLLTKTTDQQLGDLATKTLYIDDLIVERINNVSVNEAARMSKKNVISGRVTFRKLRITEELVGDGVSVLFDVRPVQLYSTVEINGDLTIKNLDLPAGGSIYLNNSKAEVDSLFINHWTKSTDQTILRDVTMAEGITIDDLHAEHLNGYREEDFLYTTVVEIPEKFGAFYFRRFEVDGLLLTEGRDLAESVASEDGLLVNQKIQIAKLKVADLNAETYNKISVEEIAGGKIGAKIPGTIKYDNLVVGNELRVGELTVEFLNERNLGNFFEEALSVDGNFVLDYLELEKLTTDNFEVEELNALKMIDFYGMLKYKDVTAVKNLTVDGDLLVNGDLNVEYVNDMRSAEFVEKLSNDDVEFNGHETFDSFVVFGNLTTDLIRGIRMEDLVVNTLSKTKPQIITGQYSFRKVQADYLVAQKINGVNVTGLRLVSDPLIVEGDVIFSDLIVRGDITTGYLNGQDIKEIYDAAIRVPLNRLENLTVDGTISWENPATESRSLSYMFDNAVTKNTNQTIAGEVVFADSVCTYRLTCGRIIGDVDITSIVMDSVVPIGQAIEIEGQKQLAKGFTARQLTVSGDIDIQNINDWNILELNSTIVRKFDTETISGVTIFRKDVAIERLEVAGNVHGLPTRGISTSNDTLPNNTRFTNLEIQDQLRADKLDGVDFREFINNRVSVDGNHEVYNDVVFQDPVVVTQNAVISSINGIRVSDVVLSGSETAQVISSEKTFLKDFSVHGSVNVDLINDMNLTEEYESGILNNKDIYINGNIIFSADLETLSNVSVSGSVNGVKLNEFFKDASGEALTMIENFEESQSAVEKMIEKSLNYTRYLPDIFFYFEAQPELVIRAPNIRKVISFSVESMTKLNLYGTEEGSNCGLSHFCPCPTQYVAELLENDCKIWKMNGSRTVYNAHDSEGGFGLNIVSNVTSSGIFCSQEDPSAEFTTVSWMIPRELSTGEIIGEINNSSLKIGGYLSDAKTFTIGAKLYVVLAIYYDALLKSHDVNSLVYEIDLTSNEIKLSQEIRTTGAVALDVFATQLHGMHLLIACGHDPAESQLHRFNMLNSEFELLRTFRTGGSTNVKSMIQNEESFVLLDDPLANSVHIFNYNIEFDNYHFYQSLYHSSLVKDIEVFYSGEFGASDAYVIVTTDEGRFFVYEYMFFGGFQLRSQQWLDGVQTMVHFHFSQRRYIFAGTVTNSTVYRIVQQGPSYS